MKNTLKKAGQILTGAAAAVTILAGRAMATINDYENPAQAGAEAARGNGMPADLVGVDGVFTKITNTIII